VFDRAQSRKHSARAPLESPERLRLALSCARAAIYEWNAEDDRLTWSGDAAPLLRLTDRPLPDTGQSFMARLGAESREIRRRTLTAPAAGDDWFALEYPLEHGEQGVTWIEERGMRLRDPSGKVVRIVGMLRDATEAKRAEARLRFLAAYDELTGHLNRTNLRKALQGVIDELRRTGGSAAYVTVAIDHLSLVNQTYGFDVADQVILATARRIGTLLRAGDLIGRASGNKLGVVLLDRGADEVTQFARAIRETVRASIIETPLGAVCATVSIGAVLLPQGAGTAEAAMIRAEEALDHAKRCGRDSFRLYEPSEHQESLRRRMVSIADQVVEALNERRLTLAYQPIVDAKTGEVEQYECLLRMIQPDGQLISAADFIPIAERVGLISLIDQRVLELALDALKRHTSVNLALNVSGMTASDGTWLDAFLAHVRANADIASRLTIELTETAMLADLEFSAHFMANLRSLGCKVALDDFGAGYTSFRNLQVFELDMVKVDGSFVSGLAKSKDNQLFVRTLVNLADNFGLKSTAECVASAEDAEILRGFGVHYLQGYYFGRPEVEPSWLRVPESRIRLKA
jgi:diguanylate cyclase (GGDEF)-like protein